MALITREFAAIGNNLNQIAAFFNSGGIQSRAMHENINHAISCIFEMREQVAEMAGNRIGKSYNDYIADHQMNMFEDFIGYQGSTVLDEPEREAGTTSIPIPQREESENIPLPDLPGQLENVQQSGNEIAERGMPT